MANNYRFAEYGARSLKTFLEDGTTGLAARCTAINGNTTDGIDLPTAWTFPTFATSRGLYLPFCLIEWVEDAAGDNIPDDALYRNRYHVVLAVGVGTTRGVVGSEAILKMRAAWALRECFDTTKAGGGSWDGHQLGAANGSGRVVGARMGRVVSGPAVRVPELDNTRAIVIVGEVETYHEESQSPTA